MSLDHDVELREAIRKTALLNAFKHDGKADVGAVTGKILGERPELRVKIKDLSVLIRTVVKEVNDLSVDEQKSRIEEKWPEALVKEKATEEKRLPPLPNADKYERVVTRFSPNPDCVIHLGSARAIILCHDYARLYKGKFILRFEDTDPKIKRPVLEFYDRIRDDLVWLESQQDEEYIQSDRILIYYEYAEKLLKQGNAYVCTCNPEDFRKKTLASKPCECRSLPIEEHLERWKRMLEGGYKEGEAVVRVKTDLNHPNPAVRDWPALRIIDADKYPHPRIGNKYHVWPLYNLAAGLDDHLMGITHIIRGKEHLTNQVRQEYMYQYLGWKYPETIHYGRLKITGTSLSKSKIVQGIREGLYEDWDDPRLATFAALRRRGIQPEAIRRMIIDIGPKTQDVILSWENLYAYNRKVVDTSSDRYFFVQDPIELTVKKIPKTFHVKLHLHPDYPERGSREYTVKPGDPESTAQLWVSKNDLGLFNSGSTVRLMELLNIVIDNATIYSIDATYASESYEDSKRAKAHLVHWIPVGEDMPCEVVMPDASTAQGIAEKLCRKLKPDTIIQFERFGFVRVDSNNHKLTGYYSHK